MRRCRDGRRGNGDHHRDCSPRCRRPCGSLCRSWCQVSLRGPGSAWRHRGSGTRPCTSTAGLRDFRGAGRGCLRCGCRSSGRMDPQTIPAAALGRRSLPPTCPAGARGSQPLVPGEGAGSRGAHVWMADWTVRFEQSRSRNGSCPSASVTPLSDRQDRKVASADSSMLLAPPGPRGRLPRPGPRTRPAQ